MADDQVLPSKSEPEQEQEQESNPETPAKDLLEIFTKSVSEMSDTELDDVLVKLRSFRKIRIIQNKKEKSPLDKIMKMLTPAMAAQILAKLEELEKAKTEK